mgnify:CR=1 FL=1|jgi:V/A-type H+-transporting ATPase subunit E
MTAETIVHKIKTDAENKAKEITSEAEQQAQQIKNNATENAKKQADEIIEKGKQQAENRKKILISQAHQNAKRNEMNAKEDIIETCFSNALDQLSNMDEHSYKKIVKQLIEQGRKQIPGNCTLQISKDVDKQIAEELNIPVSGKISASGGIILQSEKGTITIDNTFEGILKREKQRIRVEVGKLLFS